MLKQHLQFGIKMLSPELTHHGITGIYLLEEGIMGIVQIAEGNQPPAARAKTGLSCGRAAQV